MSPGDVLGRYELLMPVARGGMATVWAARLKGSRGFQKIVAIKSILPDLIEDPRFNEMFLDEASLASRIHHPHVVEILDLGEQEGVLYLVMEWVDGEPLSVVLKAAAKTGGIPTGIAVRIASQACAGLHAAHELRDDGGALLGLVHRDVSPQNLMVTFEGVVKVVDFGVAKATGRASATTAGQVKGKAAYMSPEQARGEPVDRRTDVFALGIILYLMTTGQHPFRGENDSITIHHICSDKPAPLPSCLVANYPSTLEAVVCKALAKDPNHRYSTANELLRDLGQALPESSRVVTDDSVAAFMHGLLQRRYEQRKNALKAAQHLADERAVGRAPQDALAVDFGLHSGFTPVSSTSVKVLGQSSCSGPPTGGHSACGGLPASSIGHPQASGAAEANALTRSSTGKTLVEADAQSLSQASWYRRRRTLVVVGIALLAGLGGVLAARRGGRDPVTSDSAGSAPIRGSASVQAGAQQPTPESLFIEDAATPLVTKPAPVAHGSSESPETADTASASAFASASAAGRAGVPIPGGGGRTWQKGSGSGRPGLGAGRDRTPSESGRTHPSDSERDAGATFLSPVRTPGF